MLFVLNVAPVVCVASAGLSPPISGVLDTSEIKQYFEHVTKGNQKQIERSPKIT